jgi:hypothetical protein
MGPLLMIYFNAFERIDDYLLAGNFVERLSVITSLGLPSATTVPSFMAINRTDMPGSGRALPARWSAGRACSGQSSGR